jgi:sec-independent protein translocase protein TatB
VFNVGGQEFLVILLLALLVLGPERLPGAIRTVGRIVGELRRISGGFQSELRDALAEPLASVQEIRSSVQDVAANFQAAVTQAASAPETKADQVPEATEIADAVEPAKPADEPLPEEAITTSRPADPDDFLPEEAQDPS